MIYHLLWLKIKIYAQGTYWEVRVLLASISEVRKKQSGRGDSELWLDYGKYFSNPTGSSGDGMDLRVGDRRPPMAT